MIAKEQIKFEIDRLDERYLGLVYKIICQFTQIQVPHVQEKVQKKAANRELTILFQDIANTGGLGIKDPKKWQQEIREDRSLPLRAI